MKCNFIVAVILLLATQVSGQSILDDSTKQIYGPTTTKHFYEEDLLFNDVQYQLVDTSLYDFEHFDPIDKSRRRYQNLGNFGTALFPVFYDLPEEIGTSTGFNAYDPYNKLPAQQKWYDTKSSFMDVKAVLGAETRTMVDFTFTQNVNANFNFGFDVVRSVADKQLGRVNQGDRNTESTLIDIFINYRSKNEKYNLLFKAQSFKHRVDEVGGILPDSTIVSIPDGNNGLVQSSVVTESSFFQYRDATIALQGPENTDFRLGFHLYHQYKLREFFQLYHIMDRTRQNNGYEDSNVAAAGDFYQNTYLSGSSTSFLSSFSDFKNEIGIKGNVGPAFYSAYLKRRDLKHNSYGFREPQITPFSKLSENYIGGRTRLKVENVGKLTGHFEFLLETQDIKLDALLESKFFNAQYKIRRYRPTLLSRRYFGNHHIWQNKFKSIFANELKGEVVLKVGNLDLRPSVSVKSYNDNYIYFNKDQQPTKVGDRNGINLVHLGVFAKWSLMKDKLVIENEFVHTAILTDKDSVVRVPPNFYTGKLYYQNIWFNKTIPVMFGFNIYGRSSYKANAYDPVTQQFYIQDDFNLSDGINLISPYITVDAFFNVRIGSAFLFAKWVHLNQPAEGGYFVTPFYNGQKRVIDFGVRWMFFD